MPLPTLAVPIYPFVPAEPGVPPLRRSPLDNQAQGLVGQAVRTGVVPDLLAQMLGGVVPSFLNGVTTPLPQVAASFPPSTLADGSLDQSTVPAGLQWGIFDVSGNPVIVPDTVISFDWKGSYRVISYAIEGGNFETYNKVQEPFEVRMVMWKAGSPADRQDFIDVLGTIRASLDLYTATSPEQSYDSMTIKDVAYDRKGDQGATVIEAVITLQQINVTASSSFTSTTNPVSQNPTDGGTVDAGTPTPTQGGAVPPGGPS